VAYKKYTQCYLHTAGDKPFNEKDLPGFVAGAAAPGLVLAIIGAAVLGSPLTAFVGIGVATAQAIVAVADAWLYHRLACVRPEEGPQCAIGVVTGEPEIGGLGEFDNDEFFDIRLLPHRPNDDYKSYNTAYTTNSAGPSLDGKTELTPANDVYLDKLQGEHLVKPFFTDLGFKLDRSVLHAEAEGNFWVKMKEWAVLAGVVAALAAALGAAVGCALGSFLGPIGCIIGAILGALLASLLADLILASIAFNSDPGEVEDANVGDKELGPITKDDRVVAVGELVYDGFHEGWHELHPLMAVAKLGNESMFYLEWDPDFADGSPIPPPPPGASGPAAVALTPDDMRKGLASPTFRARAAFLRDTWCGLFTNAFAPATIAGQQKPEHRWTIHPDVDGCQPTEEPEPAPEPPH
jgi:hypothetical protein